MYLDYRATNSIALNSGFNVAFGGNFTAYINDPCVSQRIGSPDNFGEEGDDKTQNETTTAVLEKQLVNIYPNPNNG